MPGLTFSSDWYFFFFRNLFSLARPVIDYGVFLVEAG
jgi:hypothetical protein